MVRAIVFLALLLFNSAAFSQYYGGAQPNGAPSRVATINVNLSGSGPTIPSNFIGFSFEVYDFFTAGFFQGATGLWNGQLSAASFVSTIQLLGANGRIRIGGGSGESGTAPNITPTIASNLNSFVTALGSGWSLMYGLDLTANDSSTAATTATNIASAVGASKTIFQMGNEPSIIGMPFATYTSRWNSYYTAVTTAVPSAKFAATDDWINLSWGTMPTAIAALTPGLAGLSAVSQHYYPFCRNTFPSNQLGYGELLTTIIYQKFTTSLAGLPGYLTNTYAYGSTPQIMSETNSVCQSGQDGLSNKLVGAAYILNEEMILASYGWAGINLHGVYDWNTAFYNPINIAADQNAQPSPIFSSMVLFSKIVGQTIAPSSIGGNANVNAIATKGGSGNANVIVVNNDVFNPVSITPQQSSGWSTANVMIMKDADGQGCGSGSVSLGGSIIGESGAWSGTSFSIGNGQAVTLGPCQAALISIQP